MRETTTNGKPREDDLSFTRGACSPPPPTPLHAGRKHVIAHVSCHVTTGMHTPAMLPAVQRQSARQGSQHKCWPGKKAGRAKAWQANGVPQARAWWGKGAMLFACPGRWLVLIVLPPAQSNEPDRLIHGTQERTRHRRRTDARLLPECA